MPAPRSRQTFRWMPAPVLSHNVRVEGQDHSAAQAKGSASSAAPSGASYGRGLYAKKLGSEPPASSDTSGLMSLRGPRPPSTVLRWQVPLRYLIVWQRQSLTLTWHAPWCRQCDCPGAGWRFDRDGGYLSGLGFELSYFRE